VSAGCDCCAGAGDRTPVILGQRPGLSAIAYRVGTHADFLASMLAGLTDAGRPRLAGLAARDDDDFTIALLDAWAVVADVLTFYGERLAQESYLATARERMSLAELGRLVGYRLAPGVAAQTLLAFAIEEQPELPASTANEPGAAPPVTPAVVTLDSGLRVQSIPGPDEQPQTFETVERIDARAEWNAIAPAMTLGPASGLDATHAWLNGAGLDLAPGDALLFTGGNVLAAGWALRTLTAVDSSVATDRTTVRWDAPLALAAPAQPVAPQPFVLRQCLDVFGHNAPLWRAMPADFRTGYLASSTDTGNWPAFTISDAGATNVDLDGAHADVAPGSPIVLTLGAQHELWQVSSATELSRSQFGVAGKVTRLALAGGANYATFASWPRETKVLAGAQPLELVAATDASGVAGATIDVDADVSAMTAGRRLIVRGTIAGGAEHTEAVTLAEVQPAGVRWRLHLRDALSAAYERATVVVHGNVASATHGETVQQLLGSGDARAAFQRFALAHAPLTHRRSTEAESGASAELEVRVNDVRWHERQTLYGARPGDRAYVLRSDEQGRTTVQFGDGASGARLPSGSTNIRARYREGIGAAGNVGPGALSQLIDLPLGCKGVGNPLAAAGGIDAQDATTARASIPLAMRTLGRAVSLLDYEAYARAYTGVAKARAAVLTLPGGPTIVVTVAFDGPAPGQAAFDTLGAALRTHGDPHVQVAVVAHVVQTFRTALKVAVDPGREPELVLAAVEAALRSAYAFASRGFAQPVHRSEVVSVVHGVTGVVAVDVDRLFPAGFTPSLDDRLLAQQAHVAAGGVAQPAGLMLLDPAPLDWLEVMP